MKVNFLDLLGNFRIYFTKIAENREMEDIIMKNEKLMTAASVLGWFGVYILLSLISARLPEAVDCAVTVLALWGLIFVCARMSDEKGLTHGGVRPVPPIWLIFALFAGAGLNLAFSGLLPLLPLPESVVESYADASAQYEEPSNALLFKAVIFVPILEETVFRGLICDRIGKILPKWLAVTASALIFAVMHGNILWSSYAFLSGLLLCTMYFCCRSILPCIAFHLAFNASNYIWGKILPLPDETWAYALCLTIGAVICLSFTFLLFRDTKKHL